MILTALVMLQGKHIFEIEHNRTNLQFLLKNRAIQVKLNMLAALFF